jgi:hypothetical protein
MQCPPEISEILTDILQTGLLRIRAWGWNQDPHRCAIEADHLHNLPTLLSSFKPELLDYYWNVERIAFIQQSSPENVAGFEHLWKALAEHIQTRQGEAVAAKN